MTFLSTTSSFFFFNDTATTEIYTLSLHDALPIFKDKILNRPRAKEWAKWQPDEPSANDMRRRLDRKSTRLNSSHRTISYAVFCLKKKKKPKKHIETTPKTTLNHNPRPLPSYELDS